MCHHLQARKDTILVLLRPARVVAGRLVLVGVVVVVVVESLAGMGMVVVVAADLLLRRVVLPLVGVLLGVVLLGLVEAGVVGLAVIQHQSDRGSI